MKLKEKKIFAQGYTESKWQNHKVNSDLSNAKKKKKKKQGSERESRGNEPTWESPGSAPNTDSSRKV